MPHWLRRLLKLMLTVGVLGAIVGAVRPSALLSSLREAEWAWVGAAVVLAPVNLTLDGWVWKKLLEPVLDRPSVSALAGAVLSGISLGFWTPVRVGEYAGRALYMPTGDRWTLSLTVFAQRMADMAVGVVVGLVVLLGAFYHGTVPVSSSWWATAAVGAGIGAVLVPFVTAPSLAHRGTQRLAPNWTRLTERTAVFRRLSRRQNRAVLGGTVVRYGVFTGQLACLGAAFSPSANVGFLWGAAALTFYVKYLVPSLTILDLGVREGSAAFFFQLLGLGAASGLNAALLLFTINIVAPALLGAPLVGKLRLAPEVKSADTRLFTLQTGS